MASVKIELRLDQGAIVRVVGGQSHAAAKRAATKTQQRARQNLTAAGRINSGALRSSIDVLDITGNPLKPEFAVGSPLNYAIFQEVGIGPVHARRGGVLRFKPKGSGSFIFRPRTRGFAGAHYLRSAVDAVRPGDFAK